MKIDLSVAAMETEMKESAYLQKDSGTQASPARYLPPPVNP